MVSAKGFKMKLSEIFEDKPDTWGLRGDPYFWAYLKEKAEYMDVISAGELDRWIRKEHLIVSGEEMTDTGMVRVEQFAHGGMSSGGVDGSWWTETGIPLLKSRLPERAVDVKVYETELNEKTLDVLIKMSKDWEAEDSCYGYRANERSDIEGNRIFLAEDNGEIVGYLFGKAYRSKNMYSVMPEDTPCFEVEELYVISKRRSAGIGSKLFSYAEDAVRNEAEYITVATATKNWKAIFRFYLDELDMTFWSARMFKKIQREEN